jgi:cellulose synthase (UDP-forming)
MLALDDIVASLGPALLALGFGFAVLPLFRPDSQPMRALVFATVVVLGWRYIVWRLEETIPDFDFSIDAWVAWTFLALEASTMVSATVAFTVMSRTKDRKDEATRHAGWWSADTPPRVDILIATYNEEAAILERTIVGALASTYPALRVWVLDDKRRPWLREMCERLGAHYHTRPDNRHAKAGNINACLATLRALPDPPDFIAVLDADFVPHVDFVPRALALFHARDVGLVQTPQHFFNPDPIQHNLGIGKAYPDEQRYFFDHVQPARDAWGIAFCCGTSSMMRWTALESIGGFPTDSVTEDFLITLRLQENGWRTVYLNEPLTEGLAPEGVGEYIVQRARWCLGLIQIVRGRSGPLTRNNLRPIDRLSLIDSFLFWSTTYLFRLACLVVPLLYWYTGITAVNAPVPGVLAYFGPFYIFSLMAMRWISGGAIMPILQDVSQVLGATEIVKAVWAGLIKPEGHAFKVTAKGGDRTKTVVQWPLISPLAWLFGLTLVGIFFQAATDIQFDRDAGDGTWIVLFWTLYNLAVLGVAMAVCVEMPRDRTVPEIAPERTTLALGDSQFAGWLVRLTAEEAWIRGGPPVAEGDAGRIEIANVGAMPARVARIRPRGFALAIEPDAGQRRRIVAKLHTQAGKHGTLRLNIMGVVAGFVTRMIKRNPS